MADNKTATLSRGGTSVDILITRQVEFNMDKELIIFSVPKQTPILVWNIDIKRLKEVITITGILLDENSESSKTKFDNLRTLLRNSGSMALKWGTGDPPEFSFTGNVVKTQIRQVPGRHTDSAATLGSRGDTFEIMLQFSIGTHRGG